MLLPDCQVAAVAPLAGAWIEIDPDINIPCTHSVAPLAGAWIEIHIPTARKNWSAKSPPSRGRGLKYKCAWLVYTKGGVAPLAGAWIEIYVSGLKEIRAEVAPLAGAWIEIVPCRI